MKGKRHQVRRTHICIVCGKEFQAARYTAKTCSARCRKRLWRTDPTIVEWRDRKKQKAE